jgi:hypothetical protein
MLNSLGVVVGLVAVVGAVLAGWVVFEIKVGIMERARGSPAAIVAPALNRLLLVGFDSAFSVFFIGGLR